MGEDTMTMVHTHHPRVSEATSDKFSGGGHGSELMFAVGFGEDTGWYPTAAGFNSNIEDAPVPYPFDYRELFNEAETFTVLTLFVSGLRVKVLIDRVGKPEYFTLGTTPQAKNPKLTEAEEREIVGPYKVGRLVFALGFDARGSARTQIATGSRSDLDDRSVLSSGTPGMIESIETFTVLTLRRNPFCKVVQYPNGSLVHFHIP